MNKMKTMKFLIMLIIVNTGSLFADTLEKLHSEQIEDIQFKNSIIYDPQGFTNKSGFYKIDTEYFSHKKISPKIKKQIRNALGIYDGKFAFELDDVTERVCANKPTEVIHVFSKSTSKIAIFETNCHDWCGEICGKRFTAVLRLSASSEWDAVWVNSSPNKNNEWLSIFTPYYVSDLDDDGLVELIIDSASGAVSEANIYELTPSGLDKIALYARNEEGE